LRAEKSDLRRFMRPSISIIIVTRNRADSLRETLKAMEQVRVPSDWEVELLIVDNGSTDHTGSVVREFANAPWTLRYFVEHRLGKTIALNSGLRIAKGEIFLFTDDDVRPCREWISGMCAPLLSGRADAVVGGIAIAPHLLRPWMKPQHRSWLASTEEISPESPNCMVGANMGFSRKVLEKVPGFDERLGPGAIGYGDDTFFGCQLREAGYVIVSAFDIIVEHHFDPSRLTAEHFRRMARGMGRKTAYIVYHWGHDHIPRPAWHAFRSRIKLRFLQMIERCKPDEAPSQRELEQIGWIGIYDQTVLEQKLPYYYDKHGLVERNVTKQCP
jgi:glucosyl-dolichyl phosphate glucuronosyltransferase